MIPLRFLSVFLSESIHMANCKLLSCVSLKGENADRAWNNSPQSLPDPTNTDRSRAGNTSGPVRTGAPVGWPSSRVRQTRTAIKMQATWGGKPRRAWEGWARWPPGLAHRLSQELSSRPGQRWHSSHTHTHTHTHTHLPSWTSYGWTKMDPISKQKEQVGCQLPRKSTNRNLLKKLDNNSEPWQGVHHVPSIGLIGICGFPGGSDGKESTCNATDLGSVPGSGRSPGGGNGNPLQYSCPRNPMARGGWRATVHGAAESDRTEPTTQTKHKVPSQVTQVGSGRAGTWTQVL